jgi:hypothetical protein
MSEHNRGAYAPPTADAPLSFDARHPVRGARPFPMTLIMTGLVLIGLIVAIALIYRSGVRAGGQAPKAVGTPVTDMKSAAPPDAQPQDPAAGLQIYQEESAKAAAPGQPKFVPPPEQPAPRPAPAVQSPPPVAAPTSPVQTGPALRPAAPVAAAPAPAVKAPPPPAPAPAPAAAGGAAAVQIGAVSSTEIADRTWREAIAVAPNLASGKGKGIERIEKNGQTLYRTAVTGFASRADAAAFCAKLKAAGKACFVK